MKNRKKFFENSIAHQTLSNLSYVWCIREEFQCGFFVFFVKTTKTKKKEEKF